MTSHDRDVDVSYSGPMFYSRQLNALGKVSSRLYRPFMLIQNPSSVKYGESTTSLGLASVSSP